MLVAEVLDAKLNDDVDFINNVNEGRSPLYLRIIEVDDDTLTSLSNEASKYLLHINYYDWYDRWGFDDYQDHRSWDEDEKLTSSTNKYGFLIKNGLFNGIFFYYSTPYGALTISGERYGVVDFEESESGDHWDRDKGKHYYLVKLAPKDLVIPEGTTIIREGEYINSPNLETVIVPPSVTHIQSRAFAKCPNLQKITLSYKCIISTDAFNESSHVNIYYIIDDITSYLNRNLNIINVGTHILTHEGEEILEVTIPEGIEEIPPYAFFNHISIKKFVLPSSLKRIGKNAFYDTNSLKDINLPLTLEEIRKNAFYSSGIKETKLSMNTRLDYDAFSYVSFDHLYLVKTKNADLVNFPWKMLLKEQSNVSIIDEEGCPVDKIVIPEGVKEIPDYAFTEISNVKTFVLPSTLETIGIGAFGGCTLLEFINFPDKLKVIKEAGFAYCFNLKEVKLPEKMDRIEARAFERCKGLANITMPKELKILGESAFDTTALSSLYIPEGIKVIPTKFLNNIDKNELTIYLPRSVTEIKEWAFYEVNLKAIYIYEETNYSLDSFKKCSNYPELYIITPSYKYMKLYRPTTLVDENLHPYVDKMNIDDEKIKPRQYKYNLNITSLTVGNNIKSIKKGTFYGCKNLKEITFLGPLNLIGINAFSGIGIEKLIIKEGVKCIEGSAFYNCNNLKEVYIPTLLTKIKWEAFRRCENLKKVTIPTSAKQESFDRLGDDTYENIEVNFILNTSIDTFTKNRTFEVKEGHLFDKEGSEIKDITITKNGVLNYSAFKNFKNIEKVNIENGIKEIQGRAFEGMDKLTSIEIPSSVETINSWAFSDCTSLESVTLNSANLEISTGAFSGCKNLKEVIFNGSVRIDDNAFKECSNLKEVLINKYIGEYLFPNTFYNCKMLETVRINGIFRISLFAFEGCENLKLFDGGSKLEEISEIAFKGCISLKKIFVPKTLKRLYLSAFVGCSSMETIYYDGKKKDWDNNVNIDTSYKRYAFDYTSISYIETKIADEDKLIGKIITVKCSDEEFKLAIKI